MSRYKKHGRNYNSAGKWNGYMCGNTREQDCTDNSAEITCLRCLNSSNYTKAKAKEAREIAASDEINSHPYSEKSLNA
jgi:hypothetical protein